MPKLLLVFLIALFAAENWVNDRALKATSPAKVQSLRAALIRKIWGKPWSAVTKEQPALVVHHYQPKREDQLPSSLKNLRSIDRIEAGSAASTSSVFVFYPARNTKPNAVIVHQGHSCFLNNTAQRPENVGLLIEKLIANGYVVAGVRLPFFQNSGHCAESTRVHNELFDHPPVHGAVEQVFLDPIARTVNYLVKTQHDFREVDMVGLSGGGWATTVYAALDPRITKSFPVAGTVPLYMRDTHYSHDREQTDPAIYNLTGYKDLYVMGSTGSGRIEIQVLNRYDTCCFGERQHRVGGSWVDAVRGYEREIQELGFAHFKVDVDETAHVHQIPENAIDNVILPILAQ